LIGGGVGSDDVYNGRAESVLVSLSDSYSKDEILLYNSRPPSCPAYTLLTTFPYQLLKVNNLGLKKCSTLNSILRTTVISLCRQTTSGFVAQG